MKNHLSISAASRLLMVLFMSLGTITASRAECLKFEPAVARLVGKLIAREYPGPPNYGSVAGDKPETQWILLLRSPLCVDGDSASRTNVDSAAGVTEVQLVYTADPSDLKRLSGDSVEVTGTLIAAHTGHHRTPVLMTVRGLRSNASRERSRDP
jgi:hypothetical protein